MLRRFPHLLALGVAGLAFSAAPALATDEPVPPAAAPSPVAGGVLGACVDHSAPTARLSTTSASASRTRMLRGSTADQGCGTGGAGKVAKVTVSVSRKSGARCRFLSRSHRLGSPASCAKPRWLSASGASSWSFRLPKHLASGRYQVAVRAVDSVGNVATGSSRALRIR